MKLEVNDATLFFDIVGPKLMPSAKNLIERPTLLVLHGGPGADHTTLRPYFDRFSDDYQVIYLDHRGCGRSKAAPESWTLDQWADDVATFCQVLGIEKPFVFGQSFGGMVAMNYAVRHPGGASKFVFSSTAARFLLDETLAHTKRVGGERAYQIAHELFSNPTLEGYERYSEVCLPLYNPQASTNSPDFRSWAIQRPEVTVHFFADEMMKMDLREGISNINCPTLVLCGAEDPVTPVKCSEEISDAIGEHARLEIFQGCGHGVHRDDPKRAESVMREFLRA